MTEKYKVSTCFQKSDDRFAQCGVATNLQFVKNAASTKHNKVLQNKVCLYIKVVESWC